MFKKLAAACITLLLCSFAPLQEKVDKIKLTLISKSLHKGQSFTVKSDLYYRVSGGTMVTRFTSPFEKIVFTNANGEYKDYNVKQNTVTLMQGFDLSSKNSLFYSFFSGSINDMGLAALGYKLVSTRFENKIVITTWMPAGPSKIIKKAEIAHENYLPIFLGFFDANNKPVQKSYYTNYQTVGSIKMPFTITEFDYFGEKDSLITRRTYTNLLINAAVEDTYLNYKIPASAKVISPSTDKPKK
jgi:hypothetical protein